MASNFSTGSSNVKTSQDTPALSHLTAGQAAAAAIIDSGVLGSGPYHVQIAGNIDSEPGSANQLSVTVSTTVPVAASAPGLTAP